MGICVIGDRGTEQLHPFITLRMNRCKGNYFFSFIQIIYTNYSNSRQKSRSSHASAFVYIMLRRLISPKGATIGGRESICCIASIVVVTRTNNGRSDRYRLTHWRQQNLNTLWLNICFHTKILCFYISWECAETPAHSQGDWLFT